MDVLFWVEQLSFQNSFETVSFRCADSVYVPELAGGRG